VELDDAALLLSDIKVFIEVGTSEMDQYDQELLDTQMGRLAPPRNDGATAMLLVATFLIGIAVGSVL
jgi:triphosphoribosyl-dephospho-CoA synthetase